MWMKATHEETSSLECCVYMCVRRGGGDHDSGQIVMTCASCQPSYSSSLPWNAQAARYFCRRVFATFGFGFIFFALHSADPFRHHQTGLPKTSWNGWSPSCMPHSSLLMGKGTCSSHRQYRGRGISGAVNFVWETLRPICVGNFAFQIGRKFPTQNPGASVKFPAATFATANLTWHEIPPPFALETLPNRF